MKAIYAWLAGSSIKKGDIELLGFNVSAKEPEGWADIAYGAKTKFYISKGSKMEDIKRHLSERKKYFNYIDPRDKQKASYKIQGSERAFIKARYLPERATGLSYGMI